MGEFLSVPNKDKYSDDGEDGNIRFGACAMQGWRKQMEDSHITDLNIAKNTHLFGVFDGHGGKEIAQFVKNHFVKELIKSKSFREGKYKQALIDTFLRMDEMCIEKEHQPELKQLYKVNKEEAEKREKNNKQNLIYNQLFNRISNDENVALFTGCTATVCLIAGDRMYFANAGDSRIVINKKGIAIPVTVDHKPELDSERNRIYQAEGFVTDGRVKGNLNLSRSLGDLEYKQNKKLKPEEQMITAYPDIVEESTKDVDMIFLGCDGVWDCKSNQEAIDFVNSRLKKDPKVRLSSILETLMDSICAPDIFTETGVGCDNMTAVVVQLKK